MTQAATFLAARSDDVVRAVRSSDGEWTTGSVLAGHDVRCLAVDPLNSDVVYAGTQGLGVLRSADRGRTWSTAGMEGQIVKSLGVSPFEPGTIYAGTKPARIFVSRDGGDRWAELEGFRKIRSRRLWFSPAEPPYTAYVQGIALSPTDPDVLLAGIEFGAVVRTTDGGRTWSGHRRRALRDCHTLLFHPKDGNWAYEAGGTGAGAAWSRDGGETWKQTKSGLDRHYGWACASDPSRPERWYFSAAPSPSRAHGSDDAQAHIFRFDGDAGWQRLHGGLPEPLPHMPYALVTDPAAPGHVYAGLSNGDIWHSADHGNSWVHLPAALGAIKRTMIIL